MNVNQKMWIKNNLVLKPSPNSELLVNQINNAIPENINDPEKIEKMHNIETPQNEVPVFLIKILMTFNISWVVLKTF